MQKKRPDAWKSVGALFCVPYMLLFSYYFQIRLRHLLAPFHLEIV